MEAASDPFEIRRNVARFDDHVTGYATASEATRRRLPNRLGLAYGAAPDERLDLFWPEAPSTRPRPIHMFVHGGYWRSQSKSLYSFIADSVTEADAIAAIVDYSLMPGARMSTLIEQTRRAAAWLVAHADAFGGDPGAISASGHSAGAHLASYLFARAPGEAVGASPTLRGGLLVSGIYDLAPITRSFLQPEIGLTPDEIAAWSPVSSEPSPGASLRLAVGGAETHPFHEHMVAYARTLREAGATVATRTFEGEDHMSIVRALGTPGSPCAALLGDTILRSQR